MHEKLKKAAQALRAAAEDCHVRFMTYRDLADRLDAAVVKLQPAAAEPATKRRKARREPKLRWAQKAPASKVKPNGHATGETPKPAAEPKAPPSKADTDGRAKPGEYDEPTVKHVRAHPGMTLSALSRVVGCQPGTMVGVLTRLRKEGRIVKQNGCYHPAEQPVVN